MNPVASLSGQSLQLCLFDQLLGRDNELNASFKIASIYVPTIFLRVGRTVTASSSDTQSTAPSVVCQRFLICLELYLSS